MIAILTTDRPGVSYLAQTIADVDSSATGARVVISDAGNPDVPAHWETCWFRKPAPSAPGRNENKWSTWRAFELAALYGEDLVVLEDDIRLCHRAAERMDRFVMPSDLAFVSFFANHGGPPGLARWRPHAFQLAQAVKYSLATCRTLLSLRGEITGGDRTGEAHVARIAAELGWMFGIYHPSLVQHVGAVSSIGSGFNTSPSWRGLDWDAHSTPPALYV